MLQFLKHTKYETYQPKTKSTDSFTKSTETVAKHTKTYTKPTDFFTELTLDRLQRCIR